MTLDAATELKISIVAYCWVGYGHYESEDKAINAFRRKKGMLIHQKETVRKWLRHAIAVLDRIEKLSLEIVADCGKADLISLTKEEFIAGTDRLRKTLIEEFPHSAKTVDHMIGQAWTQYYLR